MSGHYGDIAFTPGVAAVQTKRGSRKFYARHQARAVGATSDRLTDAERAFLSERDGFYLATVSESGWPYVQYRGGPPGFLKVIDDKTVGWADFRGNLQYVSAGNLTGDDRVSLIVMDYPHQERLKIFGHARAVDAETDPELVATLVDPRYDAVVERAVLVTVAAYDWNCRQHIVPRYTAEEVQELTGTLRHALDAYQVENRELRNCCTARNDRP